MLGDILLREHVTCCNLPATCLATTLQHKLGKNMHVIKLAAELGSTFCNNYKDFLYGGPELTFSSCFSTSRRF